MNSTIAPLAEFGSLERTVMTVLAVSGGFLLGFLLTGGLARLIKMATGTGSPQGKLTKFAKFAGGATAAIVTYLILSGNGGFGLGGGGSGTAFNSNEGKDEAKTKNEPVNEESKKKEPTQQRKDEELRGAPLNIYVLGVESTNNRHFRFEDDPNALTADEIIQRIEQLERSGKLRNKQIRIKSGAENMSVPQYSKIYSLLQTTFEPRGFEIIPLKVNSG